MQKSLESLPIRLKRILFAADFTEISAAALPYVMGLSRKFGAQVYVAHVIAPEQYQHIEPARLEAALGQMKRSAQDRIERLLADVNFGVIPHRILIDHGDVMDAIAANVREQQIDLIVAGSRGRHGFQKLLHPSTDEAIAREVACPALLIGPEVSAGAEDEARIARILLATGFEAHSKPVMEYAYGLAAVYAAELFFLHVADDAWKEPLSTRLTSEAYCRTQLLEKKLPERAHGIEPKFLIEFGDPESLILEVAEREETDLIVVGLPSSAHPGLQSHLPGPMAYNLASHAACPVLAVRGAARNHAGNS